MANVVSNAFRFALGTKLVNMDTDTFKIILMDSGYTPNVDTHAAYDDVKGSELNTAYGYTVYDKTLTTVNFVQDDATNRGVFTCDDAEWAASGGSIGPTPYAVIIDVTATALVVGFIDFNGDKTTVTGTGLLVRDIQLNI